MKSDRSFPDPWVCRTRHLLDDLWECLVDDTSCCPYHMDYGPEEYCLHMMNRTFQG